MGYILKGAGSCSGSILDALLLILFFPPVLNLGGGILECCLRTTVDYRLYFPTSAAVITQAAEAVNGNPQK